MTVIKNIITITKVVFLILILILFTWLLHKPKTIQNNIQNNKHSKSNLQKLIDQANHIFIIENFETSPSPNTAVSNLENGIEKSNTQTTVMPEPEPDTNSDPNTCNTDTNISTIINDLEEIETKCSDFETSQTNKYQEERQRLDDLYRQQLDIENDKIEQLQGLVKYYKKQYDTKLKVNNKCRQETNLKLEKDTKTIQNNIQNLQAKKFILELNKDQ